MYNLKLMLMGVFFAIPAFVIAGSPSPIGRWKMMDSVTNQPKALIAITEAADKTLQGRVIKNYPDNKLHPFTANRIILTHLMPMKTVSSEWSDGKMLDPINGKEYDCDLQLADNGQKLNVRGYKGLPLLGRTQIWIRDTTDKLS